MTSSTEVEQHGYSVAQCQETPGPCPSPASQLCSGLLHLLPSHSLHSALPLCAPLCSTLPRSHLWCCSSSQGMQSSVERESAHSEPEGSWLIKTEVPAPGPWLVYPTKEVSKNPCSLVQQALFLIGQKGDTLIGWWRCWWGYNCTVPLGGRKFQSYWLK